MTIILQHKIIMSAVLILFILAIAIQIRMSRYYSILIMETENMATTDIALLCQCKRKFTNSYRMNNGILNVSVFVEKYLNKTRMGKFKISTWKHLSGQLILLSVLVAGMGACLGIIQGNTFGEIIPFYIISMFGLYFYFAISGALDVSEKREILKTNLIDYLENHMGNKLEDLDESIKKLEYERDEPAICFKEDKKDSLIKRKETAELEELLREFFA